MTYPELLSKLNELDAKGTKSSSFRFVKHKLSDDTIMRIKELGYYVKRNRKISVKISWSHLPEINQ